MSLQDTQNLQTTIGDESQLVPFHFKEYLRIVWKGRYYIILAILIFGAGAFVWSKLQVPIYEATATISIDVSPPQISPNQVYGTNYWFEINYYMAEQVRVLQSYRLAQKVVSIFSNSSFQSLSSFFKSLKCIFYILTNTFKISQNIIDLYHYAIYFGKYGAGLVLHTA